MAGLRSTWLAGQDTRRLQHFQVEMGLMTAGGGAGLSANAALMTFTRALGGGSPRSGVRVFGINPSLRAATAWKA